MTIPANATGGTFTLTACGVSYTLHYDASPTEVNATLEALGARDYSELSLWWLSFVDPDKAPPLDQQVPGGPSFLGACIVPGAHWLEAVNNAWALGCNPGGEVVGLPTTAPDSSWIGRLLTREDIDQLDRIEAERTT